MREPYVAANWKMNLTREQAIKTAGLIRNNLNTQLLDKMTVVIVPPFTWICDVASVLNGSKLKIAAQNVHWEDKGAFTGEISATMLKVAGCHAVIVGHSERRHIMKETDEMINRKILACLRNDLEPIFCFGELLHQRQNGQTIQIITDQLKAGLKDIQSSQIRSIIFAYEPVWAIGTGINATPQQAQEIHGFVRDYINKLSGKETADSVKIIYGGSVNPDNVSEIVRQDDVDGVLVGGASLNAESFSQIVIKTMRIKGR